MNKTIYMTYHKNIPDFVSSRWKKLNPSYNIEFSLDDECINFLRSNFNDYVADLFIKIPKGMYKADLWRICKLYINGGIYSDVDIVPYINLDKLDKNITFYSCLATNKKHLFQAFMLNFSKPRNPLLLQFIISFLLNNPYTFDNGPCHDMYDCIKYNLNIDKLNAEVKYTFNKIKILVKFGNSETNTKTVNLHYFPNDIIHTFELLKTSYPDKFNFSIDNNILSITRTDSDKGWGHHHSVDICIASNETVFLFTENSAKSLDKCYVSVHNIKLLDSRDSTYYKNKGW